MENEFASLILEFGKLPIRELPKTTFLEIVEKSHLENTWSRILAFYFNPRGEHQLGTLLVKSLFDSLGEYHIPHKIDSYSVYTEHITKKGNRIDIVIESADFVIGIENKVNAPLYNDLDDYAETIESLAKGRNTYKIVLSKYKNTVYAGFVNLTYEKFITSVRNNLGHYYSLANTKYVIFLADFIDNIEKNLNLINMIYDHEVMDFFLKKNREIQNLVKKDNQINNELYRSLTELSAKLQNNSELQKDFRETISNESFILEVGPVAREDSRDWLWITIKLKDQYPEIACCTIYYEDYLWKAECGIKEKYSKIFEGCFDGDPRFWFELYPWTPLDEVNNKVIDIIHALMELVKRHEHEIC